MPLSESEELLEARRRQLKVIVLWLTLAPAAFLVIVFVVRHLELVREVQGGDIFQIVMLAAAAPLVVVGMVVPDRLAAAQRRRIAEGNWRPPPHHPARTRQLEDYLAKTGDAGRLMIAFQVRTIMAAALLEAAIFCLALGHFLAGGLWLWFAGLALVPLLLFQLPTKARVDHWLENQLHLLEEERHAAGSTREASGG